MRSVAGYTEVSPDVADSALMGGERMDVHGPVLPRPMQHRIPPAENRGGWGSLGLADFVADAKVKQPAVR